MTVQRRLIVTADDVGLHEAMTRGALEAHRQGIVTACSVVSNGRAFDHAIDALKGVPSIEIGIHLTLVEETPLSQPKRVPSLVTSRGTFLRGYSAFAERYFTGRIRRDDVEREFRAQLERLLLTGLRVAHVNGHQHLHLFPRVFDVVMKLAAEYRVGYVRIVSDVGGRPSIGRRLALTALNRLGRRARGNAKVVTNRDTIGVAEAGHLTTERLIRLLERVGPATELVCHPAVADDGLSRRYRWKYDWAAELEALCSDQVRRALNAASIQLIRPSDLSYHPR
jgi:predicted glycoside hydrolase/deacetylase ChbG (UPF0249 family)